MGRRDRSYSWCTRAKQTHRTHSKHTHHANAKEKPRTSDPNTQACQTYTQLALSTNDPSTTNTLKTTQDTRHKNRAWRTYVSEGPAHRRTYIEEWADVIDHTVGAQEPNKRIEHTANTRITPTQKKNHEHLIPTHKLVKPTHSWH